MRSKTPLLLAGCSVILALAGCSGIETRVKPESPEAGLVKIYFTRKVEGPVELAIDGVRIPVEGGQKGASALVVSGLAPGRHTYFLSSPKDVFGPDRGEFRLESGAGLAVVAFSRTFNGTLYGKPEIPPEAPGLPGVRAHAEP